METDHLRLRVLGEKKGPKVAYIELSTFSTTDEGRIAITPQCVGMGEIDAAIDGMKDELEKIRQAARKRMPPL